MRSCGSCLDTAIRPATCTTGTSASVRARSKRSGRYPHAARHTEGHRGGIGVTRRRWQGESAVTSPRSKSRARQPNRKSMNSPGSENGWLNEPGHARFGSHCSCTNVIRSLRARRRHRARSLLIVLTFSPGAVTCRWLSQMMTPSAEPFDAGFQNASQPTS
jgi:hypothetical protein